MARTLETRRRDATPPGGPASVDCHRGSVGAEGTTRPLAVLALLLASLAGLRPAAGEPPLDSAVDGDAETQQPGRSGTRVDAPRPAPRRPPAPGGLELDGAFGPTWDPRRYVAQDWSPTALAAERVSALAFLKAERSFRELRRLLLQDRRSAKRAERQGRQAIHRYLAVQHGKWVSPAAFRIVQVQYLLRSRGLEAPCLPEIARGYGQEGCAVYREMLPLQATGALQWCEWALTRLTLGTGHEWAERDCVRIAFRWRDRPAELKDR